MGASGPDLQFGEFNMAPRCGPAHVGIRLKWKGAHRKTRAVIEDRFQDGVKNWVLTLFTVLFCVTVSYRFMSFYTPMMVACPMW